MQRIIRCFIILVSWNLGAFLANASTFPSLTANLEWKGRLVIQLAPDLADLNIIAYRDIASTGNNHLDGLAQRYRVQSIEKLFPTVEKPRDPKLPDLTRFYLLQFPESQELKTIAAAYSALPEVVTAEPYYVRIPCYTPNDPQFSVQWYLDQVEAQTAYDYSQGSEEVIVGIVDSGIDTAHQDLRDNLWVNPGEDLNGNGVIDPLERNGIDDDQNGYIDDFWGWNVWQGTNNVQEGSEPGDGHGTAVAGCASAVTDNGIGISSLACKAKIMTAKAGNGQYIYSGAAGILYLTENGADVINCSWGSSYYSAYEQALITYAWSQGTIIVASAGGGSGTQLHYPAAYANVVAVAATDQNDHKAPFSGYGTWIDLCAPGDNLLTTWPLNTYQYLSGTSFSAPLTASLCCLIKAAQPSWSNAQILDQVYTTCFGIDSLNPGYQGLLGYGRIDAGAALSGIFLDVALMPVNPPIIIPPTGGSFSYNIQVTNSDSLEQPFDFWIKVKLPSGTYFSPLVGPVNAMIPSNGTINRQRTQVVPANAPPGEYLFVGCMGDYSTSICGRDTIIVQKEGSDYDGGETGFKTDKYDGWRLLNDANTTDTFSITPNPFNSQTVIRYQVPDAGQVSLQVYDTAGRLVAKLADGWREAGELAVTFDAAAFPSGMYLYQLTSGNQTISGKMVLLK